MAGATQRLVLALPPLSMFPVPLVNRLGRHRWMVLHLAILGLLYGVVCIAAGFEHVIHIHSGIGIVQNPPFLAHLVCGVLSVKLPLEITKRIVTAADSLLDDEVLAKLSRLLKASKAKMALFATTVLIGLAALADTVALSTAPTIDIYDSVHHPLTFVSYFLLRVYLYLMCYPFMFCGTIVTVYYLFRALRISTVPYRPFHEDEMGGFRKYLRAVDSPVYLVQSLTVLVGAMNYVGWGGMFTVPLILSIAAPAIVSGFAFILLFGFHRLLKYKRELEVRDIRRQQMELYPEAKGLASLAPAEGLELLKRIEAMEALIAVIKKGRDGGWSKYVVNIAIALAGQTAKPLAAILASRLASASW